MAFFLSNDVINYCYHAMGEHVAVRGAITLWSEPKDMVTVFFFQFVSSPIVLFLAVKQKLSQPKLNLLLLWSRSRRILKEGRVKRLLPQSRSGRIMNRKGSSWHALRARNAHLLLSGFDLLHHAEFSLVRRPQIKLIYFCIEDGNSPLFNDQLLIKRADNAPRKVTKYPAEWTHSFIVGMISIYSKENTHTFSFDITLSCPFALSFRFILCSKYRRPCVTEINIEW